MKACVLCGTVYKDSANSARGCPVDGGNLIDRPDPMIGRTIGGRYTITKKLGEGGMSVVYRARQDVVDRDVAIKFLSVELAHDPTNRKRFLREARAANRINHEHIIDITDLGQTDDGLVFLVMEFLDGVTLSSPIAEGPMSPRRAVTIALQIARALARAHELDVIHRDVKPDNIFLLAGYSEDFVKILDFGLAHMKGELRLTAVGAMFGTPEYMSPEQARGQDATTSVDLYALGVVLFEMLTGELPFTGAVHEILLKHLKAAPPVPSERVRGVPRSLDAIVGKLLSKAPGDRHHDAHHLADELATLLEVLPEPEQRVSASYITIPPRPVDATVPSDTRPPSDPWIERVEQLGRLVERAHPRGDAPEWLRSAVTEMEERVDVMMSLRNELDKVAAVTAQREQALRDARMRIGRALDELAADDSRVLREIDAGKTKLEAGRLALNELYAPLVRAWDSVPRRRDSDEGELSTPVLRVLALAGTLAQQWLDTESAIAKLPSDVAAKEQELSDLKFQIEQLKGRLGLLNAEQDLELADLRSSMMALDTSIKASIAALIELTRPVFKHLQAFPELRAEVMGERVVNG